MLSTFPPTECGIATFGAALTSGLIASGSSVDVVRMGTGHEVDDASVLACVDETEPIRWSDAANVLDATDVAIVQHEFGIYAGLDGMSVLDLLDRVTVPTIVVAHTVLEEPSDHQRSVLERVCAAASSVVVMTQTARDRLVAGYRVDAAKVLVIAHGAVTPAGSDTEETRRVTGAPCLLTWGLLGPGKGIEWAIDALATLTDVDPAPRYLVAGATHPKVAERSGEAYRAMLVARAAASAAAASITFDARYRGLESLNTLIRSADLVVLPYDSQDQVTSGVLVDAVAAGRPVVSTAFPHAVELLASGAGIVVPQRDPHSLADAIRAVLTDDALAAGMAREARRLAPGLSWTAVASQYVALGTELVSNVEARS